MLELGANGFTDSRDQDEDVLVRVFLDLSTAHLAVEDEALLAACADHDHAEAKGENTAIMSGFSDWPIMVCRKDQGYVVRILDFDDYDRRAELLDAGFSLAFIELCVFVWGRGYNGLWFDADAKVLKRFPDMRAE